MSLLKKRIQEGWWKDKKKRETSIPISKINWEELEEHRSVVVNDDGGTPFRISIPEKDSDQLEESDLIIEQLPNLFSINVKPFKRS